MISSYNKAISFAVRAHEGQKRKSSGEAYIVHPLNVALLLTQQLRAGYEIDFVHRCGISGLLHDVLEDTDKDRDDIRNLFGEDILEIVEQVTEDKSLSWERRKEHTIQTFMELRPESKFVAFADKYDNIRGLVEARKEHGEEIWSHFNRIKSYQQWYYGELKDKCFIFFRDRHSVWYNEYCKCYDNLFSK